MWDSSFLKEEERGVKPSSVKECEHVWTFGWSNPIPKDKDNTLRACNKCFAVEGLPGAKDSWASYYKRMADKYGF